MKKALLFVLTIAMLFAVVGKVIFKPTLIIPDIDLK